MLNAYTMGRLTANPAKFTKMASKSDLSKLVRERFAKSAFDEPRFEGMPEGGEWNAATAAEATPPVDIAALESEAAKLKGGKLTQGARATEEGVGKATGWVGDKAKGLWSGAKDLSSGINTRLGGQAGGHTRTLMALLALLGAGGAGAYALSGSGNKKER